MNLRPARGVLTTGAAGGSLLLCALAVGSAPLLVPGLALLVLSVLVPLAVLWGARGTSVLRTVARTRVQEGEALEMVVRVTGRRWSLAQVEILDPLAATAGALPAPGGEIRTEVRLARRGRHRLPDPEVTLADPLGLLRVRGPSPPAADEILVLPRIEPVRWLATRGRGGDGVAAAGTHAADPIGAGDLDGLRPYRHGAPASRIHWAALARGAGLMERRLRPDGDGWPLVVLDGRGAADDAGLDTIVRTAASLVHALARRGGARLSLPGQRRALAIAPDLGAWPAVHARLALLDGAGARRAPALAGAGAAGLVLYVAARVPAHLPALRGLPGAVLVLPDTVAVPGGRAVLATAGCHGFELRSQIAGAA